MSLHKILTKDESYHFIEQEYKSIKYMYASNIEQDNILAILKYTMPLEIEKAFEKRKNCDSWDALYIWCGKDETGYFLIISLAESKDYNLSQKEIIRIIGKSIDFVMDSYIKEKNTTYYKNKMIRGINGGAFEIPLYINEKNNKE